MRLRNLTQKTIVSTDCKIASTFCDRLLGLHQKNNPRTLIFFTRWGIHTLLLRGKIDILVLDDDWRVVRRVSGFHPNSFYFYPPIYKIIIELPHGTILNSRTAIGDKIFFA